MLAAINFVDYGVIGLYMAAMLGLGVYFNRSQQNTAEFFLGSRGFGWFPLGMSLLATLISALTYTRIPGQAYDVGLKVLVMPLAVWIGMPLVVGYVLPIYRGLGLYSIYEYLELRFDATTRLVASLLFIVWRMLWLGGVLFAPCKVLLIATGWDIPSWPLLVGLGLITTLYTFLGGMKAVVWTDVIQAFAMLFGVAVVIVGVWVLLPGGPERVATVASGLGRTQLVDLRFNPASTWSLWGTLPHFALAMLSFYVADQITAQRFLSAKSIEAAQRSYLLNCLALLVLIPGLMYIGLCLLAFYYDKPNEMRPEWVANVDNLTRTSIERDGQPLIAWSDTEQAITPENIYELVRQGRLLQPNNKQPFTSADELLLDERQADGTSRVRINVEKLAMRKTNRPKLRGEIVLNKRANEEMLPHFIATQLPWGAAGIVLAALFAASMSSVDSGLNSICTLLVMDLHRRYGWGKAWLARRLGKAPDELDEVDELKLARPLTLAIGIGATLFAIGIAQIGEVFEIMIAVVNTFGAPLLAIFLLGIFTRRCTAAAALVALIAGTLFTLYLMAVSRFALMAVVWPFAVRFDSIWTVTFGTLFTLAMGYGLSFAIGQRKTNLDLRGLVAGCGTPGVLATDEEVHLLSTDSHRWK